MRRSLFMQDARRPPLLRRLPLHGRRPSRSSRLAGNQEPGPLRDRAPVSGSGPEVNGTSGLPSGNLAHQHAHERPCVPGLALGQILEGDLEGDVGGDPRFSTGWPLPRFRMLTVRENEASLLIRGPNPTTAPPAPAVLLPKRIARLLSRIRAGKMSPMLKHWS